MDGQNWIEMDCILVNLKNAHPPFFQIYISLYQNIIYTAGKSFSVVICGRDLICKWKTVALPIWSGFVWVLENLESPGKRLLVLESSGSLFNSSNKYKMYGRQ